MFEKYKWVFFILEYLVKKSGRKMFPEFVDDNDVQFLKWRYLDKIQSIGIQFFN